MTRNIRAVCAPCSKLDNVLLTLDDGVLIAKLADFGMFKVRAILEHRSGARRPVVGAELAECWW